MERLSFKDQKTFKLALNKWVNAKTLLHLNGPAFGRQENFEKAEDGFLTLCETLAAHGQLT